MKVFEKREEIEKYYNEKTNTFCFEENGKRIDIYLEFDLCDYSNIKAGNIKAKNIIADDIDAGNIDAMDIKADDIKAKNIHAWDIHAINIKAENINVRDLNAWDINAEDINANYIDAMDINADDIKAKNIKAWDVNFYAVCFAYKNIRCKKITGRRNNSKYFVLDGKIEITEESKKNKKDEEMENYQSSSRTGI